MDDIRGRIYGFVVDWVVEVCSLALVRGAIILSTPEKRKQIRLGEKRTGNLE